jgi:DNA-binding NarL/FixJ family response regulator
MAMADVIEAPSVEERATGAVVSVGAFMGDSLAVLTRKQREVLHLMAMGYSNGEIARKRGITVSGVEQAVTAIFKAMDLEVGSEVVPRVEAVRRYIMAVGVPERV